MVTVAGAILILVTLAGAAPLRAQTGADSAAVSTAASDGGHFAEIPPPGGRAGPLRTGWPWPRQLRATKGVRTSVVLHDGVRRGGGGCVAASVAGGVAGLLVGGVVGARLERAAYDGNPEAGLTGWLVGAVAGAVVGVRIARGLCE